MDAPHPQGEPAAGWVTVEEWSGSSASALSRTAVLTASDSSLTSRRFGSRWGRIGGRMLGAFVPEGFPGSVTPDYVPFQTWDTLQGLSTYIRAMLSTQWFLRDLTGMLGGILFTFYQEGSQETLATMTGMGLGMLLAHITRGHALSVWALFLSLTVFHMYANHKAVESFSLTTLNCERASILLQYFKECSEVLAPKQVSQQEHILPFWSNWRKLIRIKLPHERVHLGAKASMLTHTDMQCSHFIHKQATPADVLKSFIHGLVLTNLAQNGKSQHTEARRWMDNKYTTFISKLQVKGYSTERLLSHSIVWRAHWLHGQLDEKLK
ncbi:hypothetical protein C2845_PM02G33400 [Panicum miliaceum]|uniref:Protein root UVB sensitive/RUS domain-containing protein n=1 Tax=Panicum miliaceum TaxID=4540 RepID=A0A3L6S838_PANMI|nr:hypothetical protein C2845_PM02G33400 [Panicum miliaceum]